MKPTITPRTLEKVQDLLASKIESYDTLGYYIDKYKQQPSVANLEGRFCYEAWLKELKEKHACFLHHVNFVGHCSKEMALPLGNVTLSFLNKAGNEIMVTCSEGEYYPASSYHFYKAFYNKDFKTLKSYKTMHVYAFVEVVGLPTQDVFESIEEIRQLIAKYTVEWREPKPARATSNEFKISVIVPDDRNFKIKTVSLNFESSDDTLGFLYGSNFPTYHKTLVDRLRELSKGIVLFHGIPGTGKTSYIRHLAKSLNDIGTRVLFIPSAIFDKIGTPAFTEFMLNNFTNSNGVVFILEDAETLLKKRDDSSQADKVSNLLNLGDGIMNDLFKVQVIATFNTELQNIDTAFLRAGRLIARKEFKALKTEEAKALAKHLKFEDKITKQMTLAEVFALGEKEKDTILVEA